MSAIRSLRIQLGSTQIGSLFALDDGRTYFRFDDDYAMNVNRPMLSINYRAETEQETQAALLDPRLKDNTGAGNGRLPNFFRNLLPEGLLRKHIIMDSGITHNDELSLLAFCGTDLPGNVFALAETLDEAALARLITQGQDAYEMSSYQLPTPNATSLSGFQPKIALMQDADGRYVMRSKNDAGLHFIGKLPASNYQCMPEVEYYSLQLAKSAGVQICTAELLPLSAISSQLPFSLRDDASRFLLVHRFDRDVQTESQRLHMEDFAQILNIAPEDKYAGDYATLGYILKKYSTKPLDDLCELIRRIKVNEMLGNYDAHLKNFSLIYPTPNSVCLSPAYDIVAYSAYIKGRGPALLFFEGDLSNKSLTPSVIRRFANFWEIPEITLKQVVKETVSLALEHWPDMIEEADLPDNFKTNLKRHFDADPTVSGLRKRLGKVSSLS